MALHDPDASRAADYHDLFDARGAGYDDAMARWPTARDEEFAFALDLAQLQAGERVLDLPAGGGYLYERLPDGVEYLAVETATSFADRCRQRQVPVTETAGLHGEELPAGAADAIVSVAGIHHEADLGALLVSWARLLRPGGRIVIADVAAGSPEAAFLDGFVGRFNTVGHQGSFLPEDVAAVAARSGLVDIEVRDASYRWRFHDEDALGRYCAGLFGLAGCSVHDVVEAARQGPGIEATDGGVALRWGLRGLVAHTPT